MNILGKAIIYAKDFGGKIAYSTRISQKNINGEWENMYIQVQMPKATSIADKTSIIIKNGFISFYRTNDGLPKMKFVVLQYDIDTEGTCLEQERDAIQNESQYDYTGDDLPF